MTNPILASTLSLTVAALALALALVGCNNSDKSALSFSDPTSSETKPNTIFTQKPAEYTASKGAFGIGINKGVFVWIEWEAKTKEVFTARLGDVWTPKSLGTYSDSRIVLLGDHVYRVTDGELWSAKLPAGPFEKLGIQTDVYLIKHKTIYSPTHYVFASDEGNVLFIAKSDGSATTASISLPPRTFVETLIGIEGRRLLLWANTWEHHTTLVWYDLDSGEWTEVNEATDGYAVAKTDGNSSSTSWNTEKCPYTSCRINKYGRYSEKPEPGGALVCTRTGRSQEVVMSPVHAEADAVADDKWVVWSEEAEGAKNKVNFFAKTFD